MTWTKDLRRSPESARAHHEKTNGSGYPAGWRAPEIPVQTRMMTISDIFDALTARDRPYKPAVPVERALDILGHERQAGALDGELLALFIAVRPWERLDSAWSPSFPASGRPPGPPDAPPSHPRHHPL